MSKKIILLLCALAFFAKDSFSQDFVENLSAYQLITLEDFIKGHSDAKFTIRGSYPQEYFVRSSMELERLYFNEVGAVLKKSDSLSVSKNFKKLPYTLSRQYKKETKKLIKKLKRFNVSTSSTSDYLIEPRYTIRIERPNPIAYTLSLEYVLINKPENKIYKMSF